LRRGGDNYVCSSWPRTVAKDKRNSSAGSALCEQ
jgi:hypothetical protein